MQLNERPSFLAAILASIDSRVNSVHTCLPGSIEKYDHTKCKADVKPLIKQANKDGTYTDFPVIPDVPVIFPRTQEMILHFPLRRNDTVLLLFCESSIDNWVSKGSNSIPNTTRKFNISDAFAIPGLFAFNKKSGVSDNDSLYIKYKNASIKIAKNGQVDINDGNLTVDL